MLIEELDHCELYKLNTSLMHSLMDVDIEAINKIKKSNKLIFKNAKSKHFFVLDNLSPNDYYKFISEYIESQIFDSYCEKFSQSGCVEDLKNFIQNYGADQVWFTQYLSAISTKAPENAAIEIYKNLYDELGDISVSNDLSGFHPTIFRRLYNLFNIPVFNRFEMHQMVQETTYACINTFLLSTTLPYLTGAGALFVLEKTIPKQLGYILERLKSLGISYDDREFFEIHVTLDIEHAKNWWDICIEPYLSSPDALEALLNGISLGIYARNLLWEGLYEKSSFKHSNILNYLTLEEEKIEIF